MIKGIGIDLIEIDRIKKSIQRYGDRFTNRIYTLSERTYCEESNNPFQHYAVRFAGKEAFLKALGTGQRQDILWKDIEFVNDDLGRPEVHCHGRLAKRIEQLGLAHIHISFSHSRIYAIAMAVLEI